MTKNIIIVGNGIAGQTAAERLRKNDLDVQITIFSAEKYPYYTRIFLPAYLAGKKEKENLIMRDESWYQEKNIKLVLDEKISKINRDKKQIVSEKGKTFDYDNLILATGSKARMFDFGNLGMEGLFTLRTIKDADNIKGYMIEQNVKDIFVVGGGLLGIELAYHLNSAGYDLTICEVEPYLLPRQLDKGTAELLEDFIESHDIEVICGSSVDSVKDLKGKKTVELAEGDVITTDMILEQVGIIPNTEIAKRADLDVEKGIVVDEYMRTSDTEIYAVGDCIQFGEQIWGIIPASREQAMLAADHIGGKEVEPYEGTQWYTRLKIAGISLSSFGQVPNEEEQDHDVLSFVNKENNMCRKAAVKDNKLVGAVLLGSSSDSFFRKNLGNTISLDDVEKNLKPKTK